MILCCTVIYVVTSCCLLSALTICFDLLCVLAFKALSYLAACYMFFVLHFNSCSTSDKGTTFENYPIDQHWHIYSNETKIKIFFPLSHLFYSDGWHQCTTPQMPPESEASNPRCWGWAPSTGTIHEAAEGWRHTQVSFFLPVWGSNWADYMWF